MRVSGNTAAHSRIASICLILWNFINIEHSLYLPDVNMQREFHLHAMFPIAVDTLTHLKSNHIRWTFFFHRLLSFHLQQYHLFALQQFHSHIIWFVCEKISRLFLHVLSLRNHLQARWFCVQLLLSCVFVGLFLLFTKRHTNTYVNTCIIQLNRLRFPHA